MIRPASLADLDALVRLEDACFETDRLTRRSFRYMLTKANATTLVDELDDAIRGYVLVLFHSGTSLARLYSIATDPAHQGQGVGHRLASAAEHVALEHGCIAMRLEIRKDNPASIAVFKKLGYRFFGEIEDYYEDHMDALRFEKLLVPPQNRALAAVPYYQQTLEFTCGPASLMMAMHALDERAPLDRREEIRLWRESTTVFMTSGHGGCGPYGLALSAHHRGFDVSIHVKDESALFVDSVRNAEKKEVIRLVQHDFLDQIKESHISLHYSTVSVAELQRQFEQGAIPMVLISSYRIYHEKFPHWVVVTGFDDHFIYVHDPYVDTDAAKSQTDCMNMPIPKRDFERMARYGKSAQRAVLLLRRRTRGRRRRQT